MKLNMLMENGKKKKWLKKEMGDIVKVKYNSNWFAPDSDDIIELLNEIVFPRAFIDPHYRPGNILLASDYHPDFHC